MEETTAREGMMQYARRVTGQSVQFLIGDQLRTMLREPALFLGSALLLIGLMSFETDKYCDGNTAQYLSCTRPAVYYYYDALDITLSVLGVFLLLTWYVKNRR